MLHYCLFAWKGNCYYSFTDDFVAVAINIHDEVSFNMECFQNFFPFSSIPFSISGAELTHYTPKSVWICSVLLSLYFLRSRKGDFGKKSKAPLVPDHFLNSCDLNV